MKCSLFASLLLWNVAAQNSTAVGDTTDAFVTSLVTNVAIGAVLFLIFCAIRTKYTWCYSPKLEKERRDPLHEAPQPAGDGFFSWIGATYRPDDLELLKVAGLDSVMFVKFYALGFKFFAGAALVGLTVLVAINATAGGSAVGFDQFSMSNIPQKDNRFWAHLLCSMCMTVWALFLLDQAYAQYVALRHTSLKTSQEAKRDLTIMVQNVPKELRDDKQFLNYWKNLYPGAVHAATLCRDAKKLNKLVAERDAVKLKLDRADFTLNNDEKGERPMTKKSMMQCEKVDAIEWFGAELSRLNAEVEKEQEAVKKSDPQGAGFVTFTSSRVVNSAAQQQHTARLNTLDARLAPEPADVFWDNVDINLPVRLLRSTVVTAIVIFLVFFWAIPVSAVQAVTTMENLSKLLPFLEPILDLSPAVKGLIEGFLPSLALIIFMAILPMILMALSKVQGHEALSWLEGSVLEKYFLFQIFNVFLVSTLAGGVINQLNDIIDDPTSIISILADSIPKVSTFFINYIMLKSFVGLALALFRIGPLIVGIIKKKFLCKTPLDFENAERAGPVPYGTLLPQDLLVFTIGATYATISPIMLPFAAFFFGFSFLVHKYQALYVVRPAFESGGDYWPIIFTRCFVGLFIGQITFIGLLSIKLAVVPAAIAIILPIITYIQYRRCTGLYSAKAVTLPVELQVLVNEDDEESAGAKYPSFVQPSIEAGSVSAENAVSRDNGSIQSAEPIHVDDAKKETEYDIVVPEESQEPNEKPVDIVVPEESQEPSAQ